MNRAAVLQLRRTLKLVRYTACAKSGLFFPRVGHNFYRYHQSRFRGSFPDIKDRLRVYLPHIQAIPRNILLSFPFLDCGFGRGEFLELLRDSAMPNVFGVDANQQSVARAASRGLHVARGDVIRYLYLNEQTLSGVSAFHFIEHLTFHQLFDFLVLCNRRLTSGGVLLLETPNVENKSVGSTSFYLDPTHIQKLPAPFLKSVLKFVGFQRLAFKYLNPDESPSRAGDLGVVGYK
jgi:SAM-dependent methyltransferase